MFGFGEILDDLLEFALVLAVDQIQYRHALQFIEAAVAEHLQIGIVGADVHAVMDVGDGVAGRFNQRVAAAFRFPQVCLDVADRAAVDQGVEFLLDDVLDMFGPVAQHYVSRACGNGFNDGFGVQLVDHGNQGDILAEFLDAPAAADRVMFVPLMLASTISTLL